MSLPSRERGLKCDRSGKVWLLGNVAPLAGAWIEIHKVSKILPGDVVAPLAGAWIEIFSFYQ